MNASGNIRFVTMSNNDGSSNSSKAAASSEIMSPRRKTEKEKNEGRKRKQSILFVGVHMFCLLVYLVPLFTHSYPYSPVLDEAHIVSSDNKDVSGEAVWYEALYNDYWGRPMTSPSSHKSWRPLTIWSFRYVGAKELWVHRVFNVITHAACAEVVSTLLTNPADVFTRILIKLLFALHPTHVEVTANAANRPHLLACLFAVVLSNPTLNIIGVVLFETMGLLCAETFIFSMPAILLTLTYKQRQVSNDWNDTITTLLPRYTVILLFTCLYIGGRWALDTLSIPDGLIRPAENPFYEFTGLHRMRNYLYVISIHVAKSLNLDFIGFSHEYGKDCIPPLENWSDVRLFIPVGMILTVLTIVTFVWIKQRHYFLLLLVHLSWMATLFPISGIIKVGTFVADRIVVASTVSTTILMGTFLSKWLQRRGNNKAIKGACIAAILLVMWYRVHARSLQWMDSLPLLQSSLRTCPRSAKSHLEMSKVHSGLYPNEFNLTKSLYHLNRVREIDPNMCDVHQQFAHVYIQQQKYLKFEEHLVQGVLCPFSMAGSVELWRRYWQLAGQDAEGQQRYQEYNKIIQSAIKEEQRKEAMATQKQRQQQFGSEL